MLLISYDGAVLQNGERQEFGLRPRAATLAPVVVVEQSGACARDRRANLRQGLGRPDRYIHTHLSYTRPLRESIPLLTPHNETPSAAPDCAAGVRGCVIWDLFSDEGEGGTVSWGKGMTRLGRRDRLGGDETAGQHTAQREARARGARRGD